MVWVFGYGSLIWKVDFPFTRKVIGHVKGVKRRFWWWSMDHRGVPESPGRVVNLLKSENPEDQVWGVAYEIDEDTWKNQVREHLDHRERGGYDQCIMRFFPKCPWPGMPLEGVDVTVYIGNETHSQYAGPANIEEIAATILTSVGPSGRNIDYLYNLAEALRAIDPHDQHIFELEKLVRKMEQASSK